MGGKDKRHTDSIPCAACSMLLLTSGQVGLKCKSYFSCAPYMWIDTQIEIAIAIIPIANTDNPIIAFKIDSSDKRSIPTIFRYANIKPIRIKVGATLQIVPLINPTLKKMGNCTATDRKITPTQVIML